jgi:acid phosphatase family membrane protein YuiD
MSSPWLAILNNVTIWTPFLAWLIAQLIKMSTHWWKEREIDFRFFVSTGGMPSAHSAAVSALATSVGIRSGMDSPVFALASIFALIVMFDAQSVRRAAGQQARLLNQMVAELFQAHHFSKQKLAELLGHTRLEVGAGMLLGILVALLIHSL